jgi:hypothetical protein
MINIEKLIEIVASASSLNAAYESALQTASDKDPDKIKAIVDVVYQVLKVTKKANTANVATKLHDEIKGLSLECEMLRKSLYKRVEELKKAKRENANLQIMLQEAQKNHNSISTAIKAEILNCELKEKKKSFSALISTLKALVDAPQPKKSESIHLAGWNIQLSGGYYRAVRNANGKSIGVHLGRELNIAEALKKCRAKEAEKKIPPLPVTPSDIAYAILHNNNTE